MCMKQLQNATEMPVTLASVQHATAELPARCRAVVETLLSGWLLLLLLWSLHRH
jgi:hypothetical protein